jgi:DMSO/TMAO reductase YedYZ molybdopterin-dependent catalytic subunit
VITGIVTALVALGTAQIVAALLGSQLGAPIDAVGEMSINHSPGPIKEWAIREFGSNDKTVLVWGIRGVLLIFAASIGLLALRRLWQGMAGLAIFTSVGVYAALSQPKAKASDALPTLIAGAVAALALFYLRQLAGGPRLAALPSGPRHRRATAAPGELPPAGRAPSADGAPDGASSDGAPSDRLPSDRLPSDRTGAEPGPGRPVPAGPRGGWPTAPRPVARRSFLLVSGAAAGASLIAYGGGTLLAESRNVTAAQRSLRLPPPVSPAPPLPAGSNLNIPGLSSFITPNASFYRVDTAIVLPEIAPTTWQLRIHGMVRKELVLSFEDVIKRPLIEDYITLCCVSNPVGGPYIGNAKWLGTSLRSLLVEAGIKPGADQLFCTSSDGFTSGTPVQTAMDGRDAMLAVAMNNAALPVAHGFPVRLVIPGLYGYVSACKWIVDIEVTTYAANVSYWAQRGWAQQAPIKTESRIDVPTGNKPVKAGSRVSVAGVAWAQHKGIEAVEVRVGNGPWQEARLSNVPDLDTWRQWVYEWDVTQSPGNYLISARATDKTGYTQTGLPEPTVPNGASGYPTVTVSVAA